jgi:AcrR family transcriptional regulator
MTGRERQPDTRERIQQVALELFAEHGYDKTALREIAERLGVTKAALYYHFKTKEDILGSIIDDYTDQVDALIAWAQDQPRTIETRREIIRRHAELFRTARPFMRFVQENQPTMRDLAIGEKMKTRMIGLVDLITDPDAPPERQLRNRLALMSIGMSMFLMRDSTIPREDLDAASLKVAMDLLD